MRLAFELPWMLGCGVPVVGLLVWWFLHCQRRQGRPMLRASILAALRGLTLLALVVLAARPAWEQTVEELARRNDVLLLIDRSESMSLLDGERTRYQAAVDFMRHKLLPVLTRAELRVVPLLFAEDATAATGQQIAEGAPTGKQTNLARGVVRGLLQLEGQPLAAIALTDGIATEEGETGRALSALVRGRVPFVGIGFGGQTNIQVLSVERVSGPPFAAPGQPFHIAARLTARGTGEIPACDLLLLRDGKLLERKSLPPADGSRDELQNFTVTESEVGTHSYTVRLVLPKSSSVKCLAAEATTSVRVVDEQQLRVLYVQGGLTWDYKFIRLALHGDPTITLSGLSRTSSASVLYHDIEDSAELVGGFPTNPGQLSAFRVVVLSNLRVSDLTGEQQAVLVQFCREQGGGVLLIGGPETFTSAWKGSALEQLLPVQFASAQRSVGEHPFRLMLTREALAHPVFQFRRGEQHKAWESLPTFSQFARVESLKPGAWTWAVHPSERSAQGNLPLIAAQRYGAGLSAVICVQNFWRWRLARETDAEQFDQFWQQFLRFLAEGTAERIAVRFPDQALRPGGTVRAVIEAKPARSVLQASRRNYQVQVTMAEKQAVLQQSLELAPGQSVETSFPANQAGVYTVAVQDQAGQELATGVVEIRDIEREFIQTARNMESLSQWADVSGGACWPAEQLLDAEQVLDTMQSTVAQPGREQPLRYPAGVNGWVLGLLLSCLCGEWILRKRWGLS